MENDKKAVRSIIPGKNPKPKGKLNRTALLVSRRRKEALDWNRVNPDIRIFLSVNPIHRHPKATRPILALLLAPRGLRVEFSLQNIAEVHKLAFRSFQADDPGRITCEMLNPKVD